MPNAAPACNIANICSFSPGKFPRHRAVLNILRMIFTHPILGGDKVFLFCFLINQKKKLYIKLNYVHSMCTVKLHSMIGSHLSCGKYSDDII